MQLYKRFFGNSYVSLSGNLTPLSSSVFQPFLQQMTHTNGYGYLYRMEMDVIDSKKSLLVFTAVKNYLINQFINNFKQIPFIASTIYVTFLG